MFVQQPKAKNTKQPTSTLRAFTLNPDAAWTSKLEQAIQVVDGQYYSPGLYRRKAQAGEGKPDTWSLPGRGRSEPEAGGGGV